MAIMELNTFANGIRGKSGNAVFSQTKDGTTVRPYTKPTNPRTPAQEKVRIAFSRASELYTLLTDAQIIKWEDFALTQPKVSKPGKKTHEPTGNNTFTSLTTKFLLISPNGTAPTLPPAGGFTGDTVTVTTTPSEGKVTFTADHGNAESVKTELLLQKLPTRTRKPSAGGYRSQKYVAFVTGSLSTDVTVRAGWYAPAYRFVNFRTGQEIGIVKLPVVQVL